MRCRAALFVLLLSSLPAGAKSLLSDQCTSSWLASDFLPLGTSMVIIGTVQNDIGHEAGFDVTAYLAEQIRQRLQEAGLKAGESGDGGAVVIDLTLHLYQEGRTADRWVGFGEGAAYAVVQAAFHKAGQPVGAELVTVSVIARGGLYSLGAPKSVLEDAAEAVVALLQQRGKP